MTEMTKIETVPLPSGQDWQWYADANVIALSPELDAHGRERALDEVQDHWRRSCLHVVHDDEPAPVAYPETRPMRAVSQFGR